MSASSPLVIAKEHCANCNSDGICYGIDFRADGTLFRFRHERLPCLLISKKRCSYFEKAVLPIGDREEWKRKHPAESRSFEDGADKYRRLHIAGLATRGRKCPDCGTPIGPKKRYCIKCSERRKKDSDREYQKARRQNEGSPSIISVLQNHENQQVTKAVLEGPLSSIRDGGFGPITIDGEGVL